MENKLKLGDKVFYTHPISGFLSNGSAGIDWSIVLCEVREGFFVEDDDFYMEVAKIKRKENGVMVTIPFEFISTNRKAAEETLNKQTKENWHNIFQKIIKLIGDVETLKGRIEKITKI